MGESPNSMTDVFIRREKYEHRDEQRGREEGYVKTEVELGWYNCKPKNTKIKGQELGNRQEKILSLIFERESDTPDILTSDL